MIGSAALKSELPLPPKVSGPLLGALPSVLKDRFDFLEATRAKYGDIFTLDLGLGEIIILCNPRHSQHVHVDRARNYVKRGKMWDSVRTLLGNGLPVSEGEFWLRQRRMIQPAFHHQRLVALADTMVDAIDEVLNEWEPASRKDEPFNIAQGFARMTMNVLVRTMFGSGLEPGEPERVAKALAYAIDYTMMGVMTNSLPDWVPVPGRSRYRESLRIINELIFRIIQNGRQGGTADNSLLSMLLNMVDSETGAQMTNEQLRDEAVALFLAGYESTSVGLSWAYHVMTQQPEFAQRVREEVDAVLGQRRPNFADLQLLPYTRNVFQEALRLYPPAWFAPRMVEEDDEIDGYRIPAGKTVAPITWMIQRHPDFWEDPARFDPDRFTPQRSEGRHKHAYTPFLVGKRQCIGKEFSMMEGVFMLARIAQRYQASAIPGRVAQLHIATTIRTKDGVWVDLKPR